MAYTLVIAEKPSVGRDIARVLGARERGDGFLDGGNVRVSWAVGHLVALANPEDIDPKWKRWSRQGLPILPEAIPLTVISRTKQQYAILKKLINSKDCTDLICATDAGREGELIFRYIYRMVGTRKPFQRLWISSMTDEAIREGFAAMKPGSAYDNLYESARCRSEADWLVGMNASRAYTLRYDALLSIGRVQTPTLALLVRRHHEIAAFVPKDYWTVRADFGDYTGLWLDEATRETRLYDAARAKAIALKVEGGAAAVERVTREEKREPPPQLYDLTSLQRDANRLLGFTAKKTLSVAQKLYEEHKLLTYPRTDSRYLPRDMAGRARKAVQALPEAYRAHAQPLLAQGGMKVTPRVFDDAKVSDHHAIIPTGKQAALDRLSADERALFDLVARRLLAAFYPAHVYDAVRVLTRAQGEPFESTGRSIRVNGWKDVYADAPKARGKQAEDAKPLPPLSEGDARRVVRAQARAEKTKPPAPHTDASLLAAMERAGRTLEDESLRETMKDSGLGTPATRAAIIERLLEVGYATRKGRAISATDKGVNLIAVVPEDIASPETTGRWEKALSDISQGRMAPERFLEGIRGLSASLVQSADNAPADVAFEREERKGGRGGGTRAKPGGIGVKCPLCGQGEVMENSKSFYCARWREGCGLTLWKNSVTRAGGPELTAALVKRLIEQKRVRGSTGVLTCAGGVVGFEPSARE